MIGALQAWIYTLNLSNLSLDHPNLSLLSIFLFLSPFSNLSLFLSPLSLKSLCKYGKVRRPPLPLRMVLYGGREREGIMGVMMVHGKGVWEVWALVDFGGERGMGGMVCVE